MPVKWLFCLVVYLVLFNVTAVNAAGRLTFKQTYIGELISSFGPRERENVDPWRRAEVCTENPGQTPAERLLIIKDVSFGCRFDKDDIAGVTSNTVYIFTFINGKKDGLLSFIMSRFPANDYRTIANAFVQKFGKPEIEKVELERRTGQTVFGEKLAWFVDGCRIQLNQYDNDFDHRDNYDLETSAFSIVDTDRAEQLQKRKPKL